MNEEIKSLFMQDLLKDNFAYPEHRFSLRYRYRKNKIVKKFLEEERLGKPQQKLFCPSNTAIPVRKRVKYILIIIVLLSLILGCTLYRSYSGIVVREYESYAAYSVQPREEAPEKLSKKFYLDLDLSEYKMEVMDDDDNSYWVVYNDEDMVARVSIMQTTYETANGQIGTKGALKTASNIEVNGWQGVYLQTNEGAYFCILDTGECLIEYSTYTNKNEIENLVKATKFK